MSWHREPMWKAPLHKSGYSEMLVFTYKLKKKNKLKIKFFPRQKSWCKCNWDFNHDARGTFNVGEILSTDLECTKVDYGSSQWDLRLRPVYLYFNSLKNQYEKNNLGSTEMLSIQSFEKK